MKRDQDKTKGQLLNELAEMRQRIAQLEASEAEGKKAEEALKESEEKYRSLFENMFDGFAYCKILVDENNQPIDFIYLEINDAFERLTGLRRENVIGRKVTEAIPGTRESHPELFSIYGKVALTGESTKFALYFKPLEIWLNISVYSPQKGYFVSIFENITERKRMEEEQQKIEKLESLGTLAGGIAHDFNNLLTGIMGNISLAKRYVEPKSKVEDRLLEAEKASLRARDLTQQLLTFARGGAPIKKTTSIAELIEDAASFALRGSNVRCEFSLPDDLWRVEIDEGQMNQVITNLIINADEAMPERGVLNIGAKNTALTGRGALPLPKGNYIEITIEDHGTGISEEHLERIFEPYFTTKQKGSGLGLATAYSIIRNHDGYITAESELGVGTTLCIYLHALKKPIPRKRVKAVQPHLLGGGRVLVMDDEEIIREMLNRMLLLAGYEVELTGDGAEAIEKYAKAKESGQPFDAVILDLTVPGGMGGKEAIKKLLEIDPNAKVIVSSGYATDLIMADFKKYGFSAVATKPYSVGDLEKILRRIIMGKGK